MSPQTVDHARQDAVMLLEQGRAAEAKEVLFAILQRNLHDSRSRALLRSTLDGQDGVNLAGFANRFESTLMSDPKFFLEKAARGWLYSIAIDSKFIVPALTNQGPPRKARRNKQQAVPFGDRSAAQLLSDLRAVSNIEQRWRALHGLVTANERVVLEDSFYGTAPAELKRSVLAGQLPQGLNVVVLGAGCVGLALANALKWSFGDKIDVLVIENRVQRPHVKVPYSRHWLTHLQEVVVEGVCDPQVTQLLSGFGVPGFVGTTLATLETLLLISNKKLGVRFLFDDHYDLSFVADSHTRLIFDATGGRFDPPTPALSLGTARRAPSTVHTHIPAFKQFGRGHHRHGITNWNDIDAQRIALTRRGNQFRPQWQEQPIATAMCKLTHVPISLYKRLFDFVTPRNADGLFYIWPGNFRAELNQILVLINLDLRGFKYLAASVAEKMSLAAFLDNGALHAPLDERILMLWRLLRDARVDLEQIGIEPPFVYAPYVRLMSGKLDRLWDRPLVPVGDSIMNGHPKVGNGLLVHLCTVAHMHDIAVRHYGGQ